VAAAAAAAASSRNGAAVVGRWRHRWDEGVQEKPRCDRSSNNSRLSWMGGIFEEGGAVRCGAVQQEGAGYCSWLH
jgi:hypothetical protein